MKSFPKADVIIILQIKKIENIHLNLTLTVTKHDLPVDRISWALFHLIVEIDTDPLIS